MGAECDARGRPSRAAQTMQVWVAAVQLGCQARTGGAGGEKSLSSLLDGLPDGGKDGGGCAGSLESSVSLHPDEADGAAAAGIEGDGRADEED